MTDKPTMKALIYASYRCYRDYALKAAAVALVPALLNVVLIQTAGQFDALAEGGEIGVQFGVYLLQIVFLAALMRVVHAREGVTTSYRLWRDELSMAVALLLATAAYLIPLLALDMVLSSFTHSNVVVIILVGVGFFVLSLRMSLLMPVIVLDGLGPPAGIKASWKRTKGLTLKLVVVSTVAVLPWVLGMNHGIQALVGANAKALGDGVIILSVAQSYFGAGVIGLFSYAVYAALGAQQNVQHDAPKDAEQPA